MVSKKKLNIIKKKRAIERKKAYKKIDELFSKALKTYKNDYEKANDYIKKARKLSLKTKTKLDTEKKRLICKNCKQLLIPGYNCRVRLTNHHIVYYCFNCKHITRIPYKPKKR
ncbi:MAG: ribonuclease P [Nitrospiraceae bacterium]|nr:ribonuclease P [Nitrospiraceae bacterium]